ncbi:hypothetical protein SteCoe_16867 [Stentor coeruleus]|uniref:Phosphodiesterase n=1 Tax=Stentor coeruleus TaxID=5963 RepID=A0A1R2C0B5_9CILI|nr:hypothetical protein SteCoe_16867 [Stentor coeruleus]
MKTSPEPGRDSQTDRNLIETDPKTDTLHKFSLQFKDQNAENSYIMSLIYPKCQNFQATKVENHYYFLTTLLAILIIYSLGYIFSYELSSSLTFQLLILNISGLCFYILYFLIRKQLLSTLLPEILQFFYFSISTALILNGKFLQIWIFNSSSSAFSCIFGILLMQTTSKFVLLFTFRAFFITNLLISFVYLALNIASEQDLLLTLLEFFVLFISTVIETMKFYFSELEYRERYEISSINIQGKNKEAMTEIESITFYIQQALGIVNMLMFTSVRYKANMKELFEVLNKVLKGIMTKTNLYEVDMEGITAGMDAEDKIFMKEYVKDNKKPPPESLKSELRKTIELPKRYQVEDLLGVLRQVGNNWNFDIFFLAECTANKPTTTIGKYAIGKYRLDEIFKINESICQKFFEKLESSYKLNPYHNSTHAADVLSSFLFILHQSILFEVATDYEILACIIANLGHDVGHPGFTNRFLVNSRDSLALTYNDLSVLEMMHSSLSFQIMQEPGANILEGLPNDVFIAVRLQIIEMILATDMSKHFDLIGKLKAKIVSSPNRPIDTPEHRLEIMRIAIKAADVGHAAKSRDLHIKWSHLVIEEFFLQGDLEKAKGLTVSMYCDREKTDIPKSQSGFIKNIVLPIYESLNNYIASTVIDSDCIEELKRNQSEWEHAHTRKRLFTTKPGSLDMGDTPMLKTLKSLGSDFRNSTE